MYWPAEAGFWLARSYQYFPLDPCMWPSSIRASERARHHRRVRPGHAFLAPDNGLLAPVVARNATPSIFRLDFARRSHGSSCPAERDFPRPRYFRADRRRNRRRARRRPADLGPQTTDIVPSWVDESDGYCGPGRGVIITIDHFGNLITNIDAELIQRFRHPVVRTGGHTLPLRRTYGDVRPGELLALVNSFGVIEIARAEQSAAEALGLGRGAPVTISEPLKARLAPRRLPCRTPHDGPESKLQQGSEGADSPWPLKTRRIVYSPQASGPAGVPM